MILSLPSHLAEGYKSLAQQARVVTEAWGAENLFCPNCSSGSLDQTPRGFCAHYTWWECGRSYLCRVLDMLHMGYVDEVLFGLEVIERLPSLVKEWVKAARQNANKK